MIETHAAPARQGLVGVEGNPRGAFVIGIVQGGMAMFGAAGLLLGPVVAALFMAVVDIDAETLNGPWDAIDRYSGDRPTAVMG